MDPTESASQAVPMSLLKGFLQYVACFAIFIVLCLAATFFDSDTLSRLATLAYPASGIYLNRAVLRRIVEWHPMYNTLDNVSSSKFSFFAFWPFMYGQLFVKLGIDQVL